MSLRLTATAILFIILLALPAVAAQKTVPIMTRLGDVPAGKLASRPFIATADTCEVRPDLGFAWRIDGWVTGQELYKAYLDPAESCADPYPFTVTAVNMPMIFDAGTPLVVSVDVELVDDTSYPGCPFPGELLTISSEYELDVPAEGGVFNIWIPLDTPVVVNGPFFAGFYIDNAIDTAAHPAVIADTVPVECATWNIWDLDIGFVDLVNNSYYDFPGRLVLYAAGIPGGGGGPTDPQPAITLIAPDSGSVPYGLIDLWAAETSGSNSIDYVLFSYSSGGGFVEIGRDFDGTQPLRDGVNPAVIGTGYSLPWNFSLLPEGQYTIRATVYDTLGRFAIDDAVVTLEPTPPIPEIVSPPEGAGFCSSLKLLISCADENVPYVQVERKAASDNYSEGMGTFDQSLTGDANDNPNDGNSAANGEYGDYYSGPVAAALAAQLWVNRGYVDLMKIGSTPITMPALVERLAEAFDTRANLGTYDENLFLGMKDYFGAITGKFQYDFVRNPDYYLLRSWVEEQQRAVVLGVGGNPGFWAAVDGFKGWRQSDSTYVLSLSMPMTGLIEDVPYREVGIAGEIYYGGTWHSVDIAVSMVTDQWAITRNATGIDFNQLDGWSVSWTPSGLAEDQYCYFRAFCEDNDGNAGNWTSLLKYDCSQYHMVGDFNDDSVANIMDLFYLIDFILQDGPAPQGGAHRADCNCDNSINVGDVVYYLNYLYGWTGAPCY